jgi:hypothetical protein
MKKILQRTAIISFAILCLAGFGALDVSAQTRTGVRAGRTVAVAPRIVTVRRYPRYYTGYRRYWNYPFGYDPFRYDPFWSDPYYTNPRLRELADRVHNENEVRRSRKKINDYRRKFSADGYITEKEQKKLNKAYRKYQKNLRRLQNGG